MFRFDETSLFQIREDSGSYVFRATHELLVTHVFFDVFDVFLSAQGRFQSPIGRLWGTLGLHVVFTFGTLTPPLMSLVGYRRPKVRFGVILESPSPRFDVLLPCIQKCHVGCPWRCTFLAFLCFLGCAEVHTAAMNTSSHTLSWKDWKSAFPDFSYAGHKGSWWAAPGVRLRGLGALVQVTMW